MKENIKKNGLADKVNLRAAFCLGKCTKGVTIKVDDEIICGVSEDNFPEIFEVHIHIKCKTI
jgi:NADH:ubiquinone oxidoreductase subunit E